VQLVLLAEHRKPSAILLDLRRLANQRGIPLREVALSEIENIAPGQSTQGVAAEVVEHRVDSTQELLDRATADGGDPFLLALDQLQDPQNVGALLRTADAAGVGGVVLTERRSAPVAGAVARASAGAVSHLPILEAKNLARVLQELKGAGLWAYGLDASAGQTIYDLDLRGPAVLVVGGEAAGLRRLTRETCDFLMRIPMLGSIESLNASAAGAIAMYEVLRQRRYSPTSQPNTP
jgi:23S rRNA (guanosine2251-2'-O)-methyltransferase